MMPLAWLASLVLSQSISFPAIVSSLSGPGSLVAGGSDSCATATPISGTGPFFGDNLGATLDGPPSCSAGGSFTGDVWYDWTASTTSFPNFTLCSPSTDFDTFLAVYQTAACLSSEVTCNDNNCGGTTGQSGLFMSVTAGAVYKIRIGGRNGATGNYRLYITEPPPPPPNDGCATPTVVSGTGPFPFTHQMGTTGTQGQSNALCNFGGSTAMPVDVWFTWTSPSTGTATVSACGQVMGDEKMAVYVGAGCPSGAPIACNDSACGSDPEVSFAVVAGQAYTLQIGLMGGDDSGGTFTISNPVPPPANDACAQAVPLPGVGTFPFDNYAATTGTQGQNEIACGIQFGNRAIVKDLWFTWVAAYTGIATLSTCSQTSVNTKIAAYAGAGCPSGAVLACSDDACIGGGSRLTFFAFEGSTYTFQVGSSPGYGGGSGTFTISLPAPLGPCDPYDDGSSEDGFGNPGGGTIVWAQREGEWQGFTVVDSISVAFGSPQIFGGGTAPNGSPAKIAVWDDPNDDGNPADAVLLHVQDVVMDNVGLDVLNVYPLDPPVAVSGFYFIGAGVTRSSGQNYAAPVDMNTAPSGRTWYAACSPSATFDYANLAANSTPPTTQFYGVYLLRASCADWTVQPTCPGDGTIAPCPCANHGATGHGCANSTHPGGALLASTGAPSLDADTFVLAVTDQHPGFLSIFLQGNVEIAPVPFGDGLRCTGGSLKRLFLVQNAQSPSISAPSVISNPPSPTTISSRSAAKGDPLSPGFRRGYVVYFRDANPTFCPIPTGSTFNSTNGLRVVWGL